MYSVQTQNQCCTRCNFCIHHVVSLFTTLYSGMEFHSEPGNSKREELQMEVVILNVVFIREASLWCSEVRSAAHKRLKYKWAEKKMAMKKKTTMKKKEEGEERMCCKLIWRRRIGQCSAGKESAGTSTSVCATNTHTHTKYPFCFLTPPSQH